MLVFFGFVSVLCHKKYNRITTQTQQTPTLIIDLNKYQGKWYEIARLPNYFQTDCINSRAIYSLGNDGIMEVRNECEDIDGNVRYVEGIIKSNKSLPITHQLGRFSVYFKNIPFSAFPGEYNIIFIDKDYRYAMVGTDDREKLWILSRYRGIDPDQMNIMLLFAKYFGYDVENLIY